MTRYAMLLVGMFGLAALTGCEDTGELSRRLGVLEQKLDAVESGREELVAEAAKLRETATALSRTIGRMEGQLAAAEAREEALKGEMARLREELAALGKSVAGVAEPGLVAQYPAKPVLKLLGHSDSSVRNYASQILKKLADPESIEPLIGVAKSRADAQTRQYAVQALGAFKDKRVEQCLIALIEDPDQNVRRSVYQAMGQIGTEGLLDPMLKALEREAKKPLQGSSYNYDLQQLASALAGFQNIKAGKALLKLLGEGDKRTRRSVAQAFYRYRNPKIVPDVVAFLKKADDPPPNEHSTPITYLFQMLAQVGDDSAAEVVIKFLGSGNANVRSSAANALRKVAGRKSVPLLAKALSTGKAPNGQSLQASELSYIVSALGQLGDGRAAKALLAQVSNPNQSIAYQAASGLQRCVDPEITEGVIKAWEAAANASVKSYLSTALRSGAYPARWIENDKAFVVDPERLKWMLKNKKKLEEEKPGQGQQQF